MKVIINKSMSICLDNEKDIVEFKEILLCAKRNLNDGHHSLFLADSLNDIRDMIFLLIDKVFNLETS